MAEGLTHNQQLKNAELELEKLEQRRKETIKRMLSSVRSVQALIDFADKELKKLQSQPPSEQRDLAIYKNELRKQGALANLDTLQRLSSIDLTRGIPAAVVTQVDNNCLKTQYITTEYYLANYRRIGKLIEQALANDAAPAEASEPTGGELPRKGTGSLPVRPTPGLPGAGRPTPGVRPPLPRPGAAGPGLPQRPAMPPRPGVPSPSRTGPLPVARPGSGPLQPRTATGALRGTGNLEADAELLKLLREAAGNPGEKPKLMMLLDKYRDLESTLEPLRSSAPGQLSIELKDALPMIRQVGGKVYYLNRAAAALGPLGDKLQLEQGEPDPGVAQLLNEIGGEERAPATAEPPASSLGDRLKSLFKA